MSGPIFSLTMRQLLGARRTLILAAATLVPVLLAVVFRLGDPTIDPVEWTANQLLGGLVAGTLLPLAALIFSTAALGSEIEDGTAVYLLSKPIPRRAILLPKLAAAAGLTAIFVLASTLVAGGIAAGGETDGPQVLAGFAIATVGGAIVYCCLFLLLSAMTSRAFIAGLIYVFLWEGVVTRLFDGTRIFSVRQYTLGLADGVAAVPARIFEADLGGLTALVLMAAVAALATWAAIRRLQRFEIGETV